MGRRGRLAHVSLGRPPAPPVRCASLSQKDFADILRQPPNTRISLSTSPLKLPPSPRTKQYDIKYTYTRIGRIVCVFLYAEATYRARVYDDKTFLAILDRRVPDSPILRVRVHTYDARRWVSMIFTSARLVRFSRRTSCFCDLF